MSQKEPDNTPVPPSAMVRILDRLTKEGVHGTVIRRLKKPPEEKSDE